MLKNITLDNEKFPVGIILSSLILIAPLTIILGAVGDNIVKFIAFLSIPALIFVVFNFRLSFLFLIIIMFINIRSVGFSVSVLFTFFLFFSFIINFKHIHIQDIKSTTVLVFLLFLLSCLPSIIGTDVIFDVLYKMINMLAFFILILVSKAAFNEQADIKKSLIVFIALTFLNSIYLIYDAISTKSRTFGVTGVMFVDFIGIAIILLFIWFLLAKVQKKIIFLPFLMILVLASILTQTRNAWVSIFILFLFICSFFFFYSKKYKINRGLLLTVVFLMIISIGGIYLSLKVVNPYVSQRAEQFTTSQEEIINQKGEVTSSLVSRLFIWDTALNAFKDHPVIGIGLYAFPYVSQKYFTIPRVLYNNYVYGRTPHIGYLAIATEAGVVGLLGFIIFIIFILKFSYGSIKLAKTEQEILISLSLFFSLLYVAVSMLMTDAWLWGQGIVLWGIILGLSIANHKMLLEKKNNRTQKYLQ